MDNDYNILWYERALVNSDSNHKRIAYVEQCFGASGEKLTRPGRVLVGEGVLTKMCRKKPKPRQFFLFNDILVYGNIIISKKRYNKQHIIPLDDVKLEDIEDDKNLRNGWKILSPMKSFIVYAATSSEKSEWMAHIRKCVSYLIKKRGIEQKPDLNCPVWVPDSDASECMLCKKSVFSVINRRHHCRKCGIVVCNPCSSSKLLLPQQSSKPQRVCNNCYQACENNSSAATSPTDIYCPTNDDGDSSADDSSDDDNDDEDEKNTFLDSAINANYHDQQVQFYEQEAM
ncbi:pleckstrin homology domain-containing family F member 2 isoform X1 [Octopus sinensis]|uniref:Pleckstrin homology domain-containing family F member 2 isoform X1 n=1 Tax=Octopus sinensis TaxID=2607531 RepID=A0A6P7SJT9_9MOLL|nr:pleckstrin homology domain-containing family F member 2 isoform X1 [Octopus sinensis]